MTYKVGKLIKSNISFHGWEQKEAHLLLMTTQDKLTEMNQITNWHKKF